MKDKTRKPTTTPGSEPPPPSEGLELPERWSLQRKTELVLRLLRGEALDAVSRESQVPAHELESWKRGSSASSPFSCSGTEGGRLPASTSCTQTTTTCYHELTSRLFR